MGGQPRAGGRTAPREARLDRPALLLLVALVAVGAWVRFHDLPQQCLLGDELHALRAAARRSYAELFTFYAPADNSIPLSLYARLLMDTVGVTELRLRAPIALAGFLLMLAPLLFRRSLGTPAIVLAVALAAVSPTLVYFSYFARPYSPSALFVVIELFLWERWVTTRSARVGVAFGSIAALACFFHLFGAVPVAVLFLASLGLALRGQLGLRSWVLAAAAAAVLSLGLLGPGLAGLLEHRAGKIGGGELDQSYMLRAFARLTGLGPVGMVSFAALALLGSWRALATRRTFGTALVSVVVAQWVAVGALQPFGDPSAWSRYVFPAWIPHLLLVAVGLEGLLAGLGRLVPGTLTAQERQALLIAALIPVGTLAFSLIPVFDWRRNSFRTLRETLDRQAAEPSPAPVYAFLRDEADAGDTVLECGVAASAEGWMQYRRGQLAHGKWVRLVSLGGEVQLTTGAHYRNLLPLEDERALEASGARYLVLHSLPGAPAPAERGSRRRIRDQRIERARAELERRYGAPVWAGERHVVFDLR